jgi:hypothetical protein
MKSSLSRFALLVLVLFVVDTSQRKTKDLQWLHAHNLSDLDAPLSLLLFVGYPRSAHSLVGAILDAHPHMVVAHELNLVARASSFRDRLQLVKRILSAEHGEQLAGGRQQSGYSYAIPNAWQNRWEAPLLVVGDKKGHGTTTSLQLDWPGSLQRLERLQSLIGGPLRFFHVLRNPYDNIATMIHYELLERSSAWQQVRNSSTAPLAWRADFERVVFHYLDTVDTNMRFEQLLLSCEDGARRRRRQCLGAARLLHVDGAELLRNPLAEMRRWCEFLAVPWRQEWADASRAILFAEPFPSRNLVQWPAPVVAQIEQRLRQYAPFVELLRHRP